MKKGTLLNYFNKKPAGINAKQTVATEKKPSKPKPNVEIELKENVRNDIEMAADDENVDELPLATPGKAKKRKRIIESDSSSDEEYSLLEDQDNENVENEAPSPAAKRKCPSKLQNKEKPKLFEATNTTPVKQKLACFQTESFSSSVVEKRQKFNHETYNFLMPQNIKDANQRSPDHKLYDKSSLFVPSDFLKKLTPAMTQWWQIKSRNFDVILFFKVGKFYELYHMDAVVGVTNLGLTYMKGNLAHCGFPEISFGRYSDALVQKGFSVARVEQTETPEQNRIRIKGKNMSKTDKTLRREICRVITKGTQLNSFWDGGSDHYEHNYLLAVKEKLSSNLLNESREFGICFVDTSASVFHIGQFKDDTCCSKLCTLLAHYTPSQILFERSCISTDFRKILQAGLSSIVQNALTPGTQFWDASKTLQTLSKGKYFVKNEEENWPDLLKSFLEHGDLLQLCPSSDSELALSALGACVYYLKKCLIDFQTLSIGQFVKYESIHDASATIKQNTPQKSMVLDSVSISNLEVFQNSKGGKEGTLLGCLDTCRTAFGKRLLRQWLSMPPCNAGIITDRLNAIEDLFGNEEIVERLSKLLSKMPDIERMMYRVHSEAKGSIQSDHPANRAILYEESKYSKKKIEDFITLLEHYETYFMLLTEIQEPVSRCTSKLLRNVIGISGLTESGGFPDLQNKLRQWKKIFDRKKALETGKITPNKGANLEYDNAVSEIKAINRELDEYLAVQQKVLKCSQIQYKGSGNKRFQMELPDSYARSLPVGYVICGQRKGFKSFRTEETESLLKQMEAAESKRDTAQAETMSIIFYEFVKDWDLWIKAVNLLSVLDVLLSFAYFSKGKTGPMCKPEFVETSDGTQVLELVGSRHPCITKTFLDDDFIPNDVTLGGRRESSPVCMLLTGPNMGGKSTLMRQVGLLTLLAHLGCYVPAQSFALTTCDRIFTRLGASDRIMAGESTFFVELNETCTILKHATQTSLVLLDELGRGTATYDGTAIAFAVLSYVSERTLCRTIFSTHYHMLVKHFSNDPRIALGHMAIMVEDMEGGEEEEMLTFLYKLRDGPCPKSYGFHAASLAGIPASVVSLSRKKANDLMKQNENLAKFKNVWKV